MTKIDRRIVKSQTAIKSAFLDMLLEEEFDSITVKEITEKSDLGRKTFYLHYIDKYDLLDQIVDSHLEQLREICDQKQNKEFIEGTKIWFDYFEHHQSFFASLFRSYSTLSFRKKLLSFIMFEIDKKLDPQAPLNQNIDKDIILKFLGTAVMGVMESYVLGEIEGETDSAAHHLGQLIQRNI